MADELNPVAQARLELDASRLQLGAQQASSSLGGLTNIIRDNWWGVKNLGIAFTAVGGAIAAGLGTAVKSQVDFSNNMVQVARTAGIAGEHGKQAADDLATLSNELRQLALTKPVDLSTITNIAKEAGSLGIAKENIASFTSTIVDLVATTDLTDQSATKLARVANSFQLTQNDYNKLGSAVYEVGVHSAATESEIVSMTTRFAGIGSEIGFTAAQTTALSSVLIGLGQRPQSAITAVQRTMGAMDKAVNDGGQSLKNFTDITGLTADQFQKMLANDPMGVFEKFINGLNRGAASGTAFNKVMIDLGINDVRQKSALGALVQGVNDGAQSYNNLNYAIQQTTNAYNKGNELTAAATKQYQSAHNQLVILHNTLNDVGLGFGQFLLPPLVLSTQAVNDFLVGIDNLPGPLKDVIDIVGAAGGSLALIGGGFMLVGPRVLLAADAFGKLKTSFVEGIAASAQLAAQTGRLNEVLDVTSLKGAFAFGRMAKDMESGTVVETAATRAASLRAEAELAKQRALDLSTIAEGRQAAAAEASAEGDMVAAAESRISARAYAEQALAAEASVVSLEAQAGAAAAGAVEMGTASIAAVALGTAVDFMTGGVGIAIGIIGALVGAVVLLGRAHQQATTITDRFKQADEGLTQAFIQEINGTKGAAQAWIDHQLAMNGSITIAGRLGVTLGMLNDIIYGRHTAKADIGMTALQQAMVDGNGDAAKLVDTLKGLNAQVVASSQAARDQASANKQSGLAADGSANSQKNLADQTNKATAAQVDQAQGIMDVVSAQQSLKDAQQAVRDAEQQLADTRNVAKQRALDLKVAEDNLAQAHIDQRKAVLAVTQAEQTLHSARATAAAKEASDEQSLASARETYRSSLLKITDAEKALDTLRKGPTLQQVIDATNKLADARLSLQHATTTESDAEWYLNYLQQEGASARDISDAQQKVADAKQNVADATAAQRDAQNNLNQLQAGPSAEDIKKAEQAVQQAYTESRKDLLSLRTAQQQLSADRTAIAHDQAYKDAQDALRSAQIALDQANQKVITSTDDLHKAQAGTSATQKAQQAQSSYRTALLNEASAIAAVTDAQMEADGIQVTSAQKAHNLADALDQMANHASGPVADELRSYANELRHATPSGRNTDISANVNPAKKSLQDLTHANESAIQKIDTSHRSLWGNIKHYAADAGTFIAHHINQDQVQPLEDLFTNKMPSWAGDVNRLSEDIHRDLQRAFSGLGKGMEHYFKSGVNTLIGVWNDFMNYLATRHITFGGFKIAGHTIVPGFDLGFGFMGDLKLPKLAQGGIAAGGQAYIAGEAGAEAIIPLQQLTSMFAPISTLALQMASLNTSLQQIAMLRVPSAGSISSMVASTVQHITNEGDTTHIVAQTNASASDIAGEIAWNKLTRRR